jgi:hypothetical protein
MKKSRLIQAVFILLLFWPLWHADLEAQGAGQGIMAGQLRSMDYDSALRMISEIYRVRINNGAAPGEELRIGLADLIWAYLDEHPGSLDRPAPELIAVALKNVPRQIEDQKALWGRALEAAEAYFSKATSENARALSQALPDRQLPRIAFDQEVLVVKIADRIFSSLLRPKMDEGEPNATDVGFRLINIADGGFGEMLFSALGEISAKHPRLFLEKAAAHLGSRSRDDLDRLLDFILTPDPFAWTEMPDDYSENDPRALALVKKEAELRIQALKTVDARDLRTIRDHCLAVLEAVVRGKTETSPISP